MGDKSHVGMETRLCLVCGVEYETGAILLDKRLGKSLERKNCTGWGMCEEHQKLKDEGYVALVSIDQAKSGKPLDPNTAYRTGAVAHLKAEVFEKMFGDKPPSGGIAFCGDELIKKLESMAGGDE